MNKTSDSERRKYDRYSELIDRLFREGGLPEDESTELEQLRVELDDIEYPYYEPVIDELKGMIDKLSK